MFGPLFAIFCVSFIFSCTKIEIRHQNAKLKTRTRFLQVKVNGQNDAKLCNWSQRHKKF